MVTDIPQVAVGVREGDILAGKYRVERILGVGGMGVGRVVSGIGEKPENTRGGAGNRKPEVNGRKVCLLFTIHYSLFTVL